MVRGDANTLIFTAGFEPVARVTLNFPVETNLDDYVGAA